MRLFLAVEPGDLLPGLIEIRRRWIDAEAGWRPVAAASLHLTLRFLGEVCEPMSPAWLAGWRTAARVVGPFEMRLDGCGRFPPRGRPRVLWCGLADDPAGSLARLAAALESAARVAGFAAETRPFRPHITLARARPSAAPRRVEPAPVPPSSSTTVGEIVLFRSELAPGGARYTAVERFRLAGDAEESS